MDGGGSAKGAYYGEVVSSSNTGSNDYNDNFLTGLPAKFGSYSYSIKGGPAPQRPPREFLEHQQ